MTLAGALRSILKNYKLALTAASGATAATERSAPSSEGEGHRTKTPRDFGSEAAEIEQLVIRVARIVQARMDALRHTPGLTEPRFDNAQDKTHPIRKATRQNILAEEGVSAVEVAWLYRVTERHVRNVRHEAGRDQQTGERRDKSVAPVTEPPRETERRRSVQDA